MRFCIRTQSVEEGEKKLDKVGIKKRNSTLGQISVHLQSANLVHFVVFCFHCLVGSKEISLFSPVVF